MRILLAQRMSIDRHKTMFSLVNEIRHQMLKSIPMSDLSSQVRFGAQCFSVAPSCATQVTLDFDRVRHALARLSRILE